jgi:hypothetical protein
MDNEANAKCRSFDSGFTVAQDDTFGGEVKLIEAETKDGLFWRVARRMRG